MSLDLKKKEMELKRVVLAKEEIELRIEEKHDEIKTLEHHVSIQSEHINKLTKELHEMKK
jgi:predicted RNase H-like nuclease (RuvC/YqgF family)